MAKIKKLKLSLKTSPEAFAGTGANIYLGIATGGAGRLYRVPTRQGDLAAGNLDIYETELADGQDLAHITGLVLVNGMNGTNPGWRVLWARVEAVDGDGRAWLLADAMLQRWLDTKDGASPAAFLPLKHPFELLETGDTIAAPGQTFLAID
jgi:hypothetical protein